MAEEESNVTGVKQAISHLRAIWGTVNPDLAIICGSGWGGLSEIFNDTKYISYGDIPGYSSTTVEGHEGVLRLCEINQKQILGQCQDRPLRHCMHLQNWQENWRLS